MKSENESRVVAVLRVTSYLLLLAGILTVLPYPLFYVIKRIVQASGSGTFAPGHAAMMFIFAGELVLCIPMLSIPGTALWLRRKNDSHDDKFHVLSRGFFRYLPALSLGLIELFYTAKTGNAYIPGVFGTLLIIYSSILLKIDSGDAR